MGSPGNQSRLVLLLFAGACSFDPASVSGLPADQTGDGPAADSASGPDGPRPVDGAPRPDGLPGFGGPIMVIDTGFTDDDPSLTGDELEVFFGSDAGLGTDEDIWTAHRDRVDAAFGTPVEINPLATDLEDTTMKVSADGLTMVFTRVEAANNPDLFLATRPARTSEWSAAVALTELNTDDSEWSPFLLADGRTLLFCSNRLGDEEIFAATRASASAPFGQPVQLTGLGTSDHECDPMMPSPDLIFFVRQYAANLGDSDIFMARRLSGWEFGEVVRLDELATPSQDRDPWVSADLSRIWFASDRGGAYDVFMATR